MSCINTLFLEDHACVVDCKTEYFKNTFELSCHDKCPSSPSIYKILYYN